MEQNIPIIVFKLCVDPLDGYYPGKKDYKSVDPLTKVPISMDTLKENMRRFNVELEVIQAYSNPFPDELWRRTFSTAYIDGDHDGDAPMQDFLHANVITTGFVTFDNCDPKHPAVLKACEYAEYYWRPYKRQGITCIVKRP